jgi:hypothetical protein
LRLRKKSIEKIRSKIKIQIKNKGNKNMDLIKKKNKRNIKGKAYLHNTTKRSTHKNGQLLEEKRENIPHRQLRI